MRDVICPGCQRQVESAATEESACPHCGFIPSSLSAIEPVFEGIMVRKLARRQRWLQWIILVWLGAYAYLLFALVSRDIVLIALAVVTWIGSLIACLAGMLRMAITLRYGVALCILLIATCWIPFINLLMLLFVNSLATKVLRRAGVRVGFLGAKDSDVVRRLSPFLCLTCGYNLTGNVSGICPECGSVVRDRLPSRLREEHNTNP